MTSNVQKFKLTKYACYSTYITMSSVFALPPLLFITFHEFYNVSYTLLGTLVLINFLTQLTIDLIFSFFSKHFNIIKSLKIMPLLTSLGMFIYAFTPYIFQNHIYAGLLIGTVIFSVSAGLSEVLLSPTIAAIPSDNPERDMSILHSLYAYGVLFVIIISTAFFKIFGNENWMFLTMFWAVLPIISFVFFCISPVPDINISHNESSEKEKSRKKGLLLCVLCIFLGSAAENSMTNWISGYLETALLLPKVTGDIVGMAFFAIALGFGRSLYAKYGKNISLILLSGMIGASVCYLLTALSTNIIICVCACVLTGFCTSMLWPGTLIFMEEKFPNCGVSAYALMAAGGDFGGSVAPQLIGIVVDKTSQSNLAQQLGNAFNLSAEQTGMKAGMLTASLFPILGIFLLIYMRKYFKNKNQ